LGERFKTGIWIDREVWKNFKKKVIQQGFSTCFILETLLRAYAPLEDRKGAPQGSVEKIVVNQKIEYLVERPRRKGEGRVRTPLENCYFNGCWTYRAPMDGDILSDRGHVSECACSVCKPFVPRLQRNSNLSRAIETLNY